MKKILIVEDEKDIAQLYAESFESDGHDVKVCYDGREALKVVLEFKPDLIILDIQLPGMSGIEVLKILKQDQLTSGIKIVMLTNVSDVNFVNLGFAEKCDAYFIKNIYTIPQLKEEIKQYL